MRVFITGATGYIGSAVVARFVRAGWEVGGLIRQDAKAAEVRRAGAIPIRGNLRDPETYQSFAAVSDVVIHAAFESGPSGIDADTEAVEALTGALIAEGGKKVLVYTSGVWVLGNRENPADESTRTKVEESLVSWRPLHEKRVLDAANDDLATAVVRPGMVYGGSGGILAAFFSSAVREGAARYIGDGTNRWPLVHRDDLADLYFRIAESRSQGLFHGVDNHPLPVERIASACSAAAGAQGRTLHVSADEARNSLGQVADLLVLDQNVITSRASELGWAPQGLFEARVRDAFDEWNVANAVGVNLEALAEEMEGVDEFDAEDTGDSDHIDEMEEDGGIEEIEAGEAESDDDFGEEFGETGGQGRSEEEPMRH